MSTTEITNSADVIDSRDVIARIEELESEREALCDALCGSDSETINDTVNAFDESDEGLKLIALKALAEECEGYASDWQYGEPLIRDSYFKEYAMELADDIGATNGKQEWPLNCIDWDQAARELQMDYTSVDFDGVTYWIR
jgi:hypothetical protein